MWRIDFVVGFAVPTKFAMILWLMRFIILYAFWSLNHTRESWMTPFPTVFMLRDTRVSVSHSNHCNKPSNIETLIYKAFSFSTTLGIPYIDPHDCHIWFGRHFDHPRLGCKSNTVEDLILLDNIFNIAWYKVFLRIAASLRIVWDAYDLEIEL